MTIITKRISGVPTVDPLLTVAANYVLAGPASGGEAAPGWRQLVAADIGERSRGSLDKECIRVPQHGKMQGGAPLISLAQVGGDFALRYLVSAVAWGSDLRRARSVSASVRQFSHRASNL
jgi:hypothetical protein